jgi:hypothetical protein
MKGVCKIKFSTVMAEKISHERINPYLTILGKEGMQWNPPFKTKLILTMYS